ncbi:MAG: hypothetical protein AAF224_12070 [Pseudomonadota bacterium]
MALEKGVLDPKKRDPNEMFIGWAPAPSVDRRFLIGALPARGLAAAGGAYAVASNLSDPGAGSWNTGATHTVRGYLTRGPYPIIRTPDAAAPSGVRTTLVVAEGKCTSGLAVEAVDGRAVTASGVLIERKGRQMLEVPLLLDKWLEPAPALAASRAPGPTVESLGQATLRGTVMDTKCFFGVMRPARGRTHKACASLCIRGGVPPSFWARTKDGREAVLLMTDAGGEALGEEILPLVADAVEATGEIFRIDDIIQFRVDASAYRRV